MPLFGTKQKPPAARYSICETITAGPTTPRHLRVLVDELKPGGGADSPALCGREVAWDIREIPLAEVPREIAYTGAVGRLCTTCGEAATALLANT